MGELLDIARKSPEVIITWGDWVRCLLLEPSQAIEFSQLRPNTITLGNELIGQRKIPNFDLFPAPVVEYAKPSDFRSMPTRFGLQSSQGQNQFGLWFFDLKKFQKECKHFCRVFVAGLPAIKWATVIGIWVLAIIRASQDLGQKLDSLFIDHSDLDAGMVPGRLPALAAICSIPFDTDVSFTVNQASKIC